MKLTSSILIALTIFALSACKPNNTSSPEEALSTLSVPKAITPEPNTEKFPAPDELPCPISSIPENWNCASFSEFAILIPSDFSGMGGGDAGNFESSDGKQFILSDYFDFRTNALLTEGKLKEFYELRNRSLCSETESCPKIISAEYATLGGKRFLKYEEENVGGSIDKPGAPFSTFHYATRIGDYLVDFMTPDKQVLPIRGQENSIVSERVDEALFEQIVATLVPAKNPIR